MTLVLPNRLPAILLLFFLTLALFLLPKPSFAQDASTSSGSLNTSRNYPMPAYIPPQSPNGATVAIYNFGHAMSCILIGHSAIAPCIEYQFYKNAQGFIESVPVLSNANTNNGALGLSLSMIGEVIGTPPVRSSEFIADLGKQLGIKSANAQVGGSGSGVLAPIFKLWEVSRNIAYLAMILIFIIVGLMVMFRQKLNPQTVVSVQMALPGLVVGLVMITFSYFLASLISDIAFLGTNIVGYYFSLADPAITTPTQLPLINKDSNTEDNVLTIFSRYTGILNTGNIKSSLDAIWPYLKDPNTSQIPIIKPILGLTSVHALDPQDAISILANMLAIQFILPFGNMFGGWGQFTAAVAPTAIEVLGGTTWMVALSLSWIAMIALMYSMFKLLLRLINNFLSIIFLTIAAPFYFLAASIPGRQNLATTWMFNMLCNVLAFPAVFAVFYFAAFMLGGQNSNGTEGLFEIGRGTSLTGTNSFPLLGGLEVSFLNRLLAFGALLATPSIPDIICRVVGKPSQLGGIAAGALGGAIASGQRYQGQISGGMTGFANNIGRMDSQPGYIVQPVNTPQGVKYTFHKPRDEREGRLAVGVQRGQWSKLSEGFGKVFGGRRRPGTPPPPPPSGDDDDYPIGF